MPALRVFISSTCYDLSEIRNQLYKLCKDFGYEALLSERGDILFDPSDSTHKACLRTVEKVDFVIAIIGGRFGGTAVPDAISYVGSPRKFDSKNYSGCSISQLEVIYAFELGIPVFTFVMQDLWSERRNYEANKDIADFKITSIDKQNTAHLIFGFINSIHSRLSAIEPFRSFDDIQVYLIKQWSLYFQRLVSEQRKSSFQDKLAKDGVKYDVDLATKIELLGVRMASANGSLDTSSLGPLIRQANSLKIMFVSGDTFITAHLDNIKNCIEAGAKIQVILAKPNSDFIREIESIEGRPSEDGITPEIIGSINKLKRAVREANKTKPFKVEYGHFSTHLRVSMVIIDNKHCHVVLNYPPKRTRESLGLRLERQQETEQGVVADLIGHFDAVFQEIKKTDQIYEIC